MKAENYIDRQDDEKKTLNTLNREFKTSLYKFEVKTGKGSFTECGAFKKFDTRY
jgi:hypothetical protein